MKQDEREIAEVLKSELEFIKSGGYVGSPGEPRGLLRQTTKWR